MDDLNSPEQAYGQLLYTQGDAVGGVDNQGQLIVWSWIRGYQARNYDGSIAPNHDREWVLQKKVTRPDGTIRYHNFWGFQHAKPAEQPSADETLTVNRLIQLIQEGKCLDEILR